MSNTATKGEAPYQPAPIEFWARKTVLEFFGGDRPIHTSTLYRGVHDGIYPKPVNVAPGSVRWLASECRAAALRMIRARDEPPARPERRGRPRRKIII